MRLNNNIIHLTIIFIIVSCNTKHVNINEIHIYNTLLNDLYSIEYCHFPMIPPEHYLGIADTNSDSYKKYELRYNKTITEFYQDIDTLNLILFVFDSLKKLDLTKDRDFLLNHLSIHDSSYIRLIKKNDSTSSKKLDITQLHQRNINFINFNKMDSNIRCHFGKKKGDFLIGVIGLSSILFDEEQKIGIFNFNYTGSCNCGYGEYVFIRKDENGKWIIVKKIINWIS